MKRIAGLVFSAAAIAVFATGCQTTKNLTDAERREAVMEAAVKEDGQESSMSDADYDPNEVICKTRKATGTRLGNTKDCRTAKEWRDAMSEANRTVGDMQNRNSAAISNFE